MEQISRRRFLKSAAVGIAGAGIADAMIASATESLSLSTAAQKLSPVGTFQEGGLSRTWLGPEFWGNRLQDWRLHDGWIECIAGKDGDDVRTVSLLTEEIVSGRGEVVIQTEVRMIEDA